MKCRTPMWTQEEVQQAGRTLERAALSDDVVSPEEGEDLSQEAARTTASGDTAKLRQLGVDLEFQKNGDVGTCSIEVEASILVSLATRSKHTSVGGPRTGDVAPTCCAQLTRPRHSASSHRRQSGSFAFFVGIGAIALSCSIKYVFSLVTFLANKMEAHGAMGAIRV